MAYDVVPDGSAANLPLATAAVEFGRPCAVKGASTRVRGGARRCLLTAEGRRTLHCWVARRRGTFSACWARGAAARRGESGSAVKGCLRGEEWWSSWDGRDGHCDAVQAGRHTYAQQTGISGRRMQGRIFYAQRDRALTRKIAYSVGMGSYNYNNHITAL